MRSIPRECAGSWWDAPTARARAATWIVVLGLAGCGRLRFEPLQLPGDAAIDANAESGSPEATVPDANGIDASNPDANGIDASGTDASSADANGIDAGRVDASTTDAAGLDASGMDASGIDASRQDAASMMDAAPPGLTCNDGIQNGTETGIDCGGTMCGACPRTCGDGVQNGDETGVDCGGTTCSACSPTGNNTPPAPVIHVTPGVGNFDTGTPTPFTASAAGTWDVEDPANTLTYEWDWNNDGVFDPADRGVMPPSHVYSAPGNYTLVLRVTDTGGLRGYASHLLVVRAAIDVITVMSDSDPLPSAGPGPTLRQAIAQANTTAGRQSIYIPAGTVIGLANMMLDSSDAAGLDVIGDGAVIDGTNLNGATRCLPIISDNNLHLGLEIRNCPGSPYDVSGTNNVFGRGYVHDNSAAMNLAGSSNTFGPGNVVSFNDPTGIVVQGPNVVERSTFHNHSRNGIELGGLSDGTRVIGNTCYRNASGIVLTSGANSNTLIHNTLVDNNTSQIAFANGVTGEIVRNNVLAFGLQWGMIASSAVFGTLGPNAYFGNVAGACNNCGGVLGTQPVITDPLLINVTARDYRLSPSSPAINVGVDTGFDVNGPASGSNNYNGPAPDLGANESP